MEEIIYLKAGKILELIQVFEKEFKILVEKYNISKSNDKRSLSNMNSFLIRNKIINEEEYLVIKKVIEERNYIIHRLFIESEEDYLNRFNSIKEVVIKSLEIFKSK